MKNVLLILLALLLIVSCKETEQKKEPKKYTIEQFYENISYGGGAFSNDESKLLVSCNKTGIYNVYEIDIAEGTEKQITFSEKETFFAIGYVPVTGQILYSADKGGNENNHIYLIKDDSTTVDLTPGENEKAGFGGWSDDKKFMYYTSNKRDAKFFDLYKMKIDDWTSEMIYQNDDGMNISGMSEDENFFALTKSITSSENKLFLVDRKADKKTEISVEPGNYDASGFSNDNKYFYYITNVGKEFAYLVQYEIETGKTKVLYETDWDVMYSYLSENEKYRVIGINEDGKNNLVILDNATQKAIVFPEVDGDIKGVNNVTSWNTEQQAFLPTGRTSCPKRNGPGANLQKNRMQAQRVSHIPLYLRTNV